MSIIVNFFLQLINFIDIFFNKLLKRDFRGLLFDKMQKKFTKVKIENKTINFYSPNSILSWRVKTYFSKEPETLDWIKKFKKKKSSDIIFWDIGANIGLYSIYSCVVHSNDISVVSFEPSVNNLKSLATNISINNYNNQIKVLSNPLSNTNKFSKLNESSILDGSALNSFSNNLNFEGKIFQPAISYKTLGFSLDYLVENSFLKIPDFIKIDVDGNEHLILEGFRNNLTNNKILQIMVEVNENYREQLDTILNIMKDCNFKLTDKFKASIPNGEIDKFSKTYNYLFER